MQCNNEKLVVFFEEGKKNGIYLRTLGNIVMLVPPLAIQEKEYKSNVAYGGMELGDCAKLFVISYL